MAWWHRAIIRSLLFFERLASYPLGRTAELAALYAVYDDGDTAREEQQDLMTLSSPQQEEEHAGGPTALQRRRCTVTRCVSSVVGFVVFLALESIYYLVHFLSSDEDKQVFQKGWILEFVLILVWLGYFCCTPLHLSLLGTEHPQQRVKDLADDRGTRVLVNVSIGCLMLYTVADFFFFEKLFPGSVSVQVLYLAGILFSMCTFYGALLLAILSIRVVLLDLFELERLIDADLEETSVSGRYRTFDGDSNAVFEKWNSWMAAYRRIRHNMHVLSERFGPIMFLGIFFFLVDTSTVITSILVSGEGHADDEGGDQEMEVLDVLAVLAAFGSNATMLILTTFTLGFTVTECQHYVGPKLSMLAMTMPDTIVHRTHALASTFILAPVRMHVGNFEFSPEYANFVALWFLALLLLALGYTAPGSE